jgi:hypothetical protein
MHTAILLHGQLRTFESCIESIKKYVIEPLQAYVYVDVWSDRGISLYAEKHGLGSVAKNETITEQHILKHLSPSYLSIENYGEWRNALADPYAHVMATSKTSATPRNYKLFKMREFCERYDCVILMRPDTIFYESIPTYIFDDLNCVWHDRTFSNKDERFCHDTFNVMSGSIAETYCGLYAALPELWKNDFIDEFRYTTNLTSKLWLDKNHIRMRGFKNSRRFFETYRNEANATRPTNNPDDHYEQLMDRLIAGESLNEPLLLDWARKNHYFNI